MDRLLIELGTERDRCGAASVIDASGHKICGPFPIAARASDTLAAANNNPRRDPLLRCGDTPTGQYAVRQLLKSGNGTKFPSAQFGPHGVIVIEAISGDAARAEANGRFHFLIAGGALSKSGQLRSTAGSLRLSNAHQRTLFSYLQEKRGVRCEVIVRDDIPDLGTVFVDPTCQHDDPESLPASNAIAGESWRGTVATAVALGLTVSFVVAGGSEPAHASIPSAPTDSPAALGIDAAVGAPEAALWTTAFSSESTNFVLPDVRDHYVKVAYACIEDNQTCVIGGTPCCNYPAAKCRGKFPITTCH